MFYLIKIDSTDRISQILTQVDSRIMEETKKVNHFLEMNGNKNMIRI